MTTGTTDQPIAQARRSGAGLNVLLSLTLLGLLMIMWLALSIETTTFWTANNISNLLRQGAMIAILAIGETFAIITGGIDLSVGAIAGFVSMMVALLLTHDLGLASSIGGAVAPFVVLWIYFRWGWRPAFMVPGTLGFLWLIAWRWLWKPSTSWPF